MSAPPPAGSQNQANGDGPRPIKNTALTQFPGCYPLLTHHKVLVKWGNPAENGQAEKFLSELQSFRDEKNQTIRKVILIGLDFRPTTVWECFRSHYSCQYSVPSKCENVKKKKQLEKGDNMWWCIWSYIYLFKIDWNFWTNSALEKLRELWELNRPPRTEDLKSFRKLRKVFFDFFSAVL